MNPAAGRLKSSHSSTTTSQSSIQRITLQTSFLSSIRSELGSALSSCARMLPIASSCASAASVMSMLSWQRSVNCPTRCSCAGILTTLHSARILKRKFKPFETMEVFLPMKQMIPLKKQSKKAQRSNMPSSAVAGMVFPLSQELCQMVKPMTEIELNEEIENLLTESAAGQPSRRTGSAYRREMRIRKNDSLMRIVTRRYVPHAGYIDYGFDGDTLLHSGKYIKYPKNSNCQRWMKRETSRKSRNCQDLPRKGNYYRRLFDYWWTLY